MFGDEEYGKAFSKFVRVGETRQRTSANQPLKIVPRQFNTGRTPELWYWKHVFR
jgi:hypothetical protein